MFGIFIVACGTTHVMEIWTLWHPTYWLSGLLKVVTAFASIYTAIMLVPLIPKAAALPSPAQVANVALGNEITERKRIEEHIRTLNTELEQRVLERTAALKRANEQLEAEIIDRKQAEERLTLALEAADMSTWDWDILTNHITRAGKHEKLFGLTPGTFGETYEAALSYVHPEDRQLLAQAVVHSIRERVRYDQEFRIVWPDGSIRWLAGKGQVFCDETGSAMRMVGISVDITDRKQAAEQITASLKEKEVLLQEIHHRVKNNMQVICSLLNLSGAVEESKTLELLQKAQNRVASMALVHEQLYQSKDLARIDFAEYIQNLVCNLFSSYDVGSDQVALKINVDNVLVGINAAIPCGLIINELVSNSLKYAFPSKEKGEVCIDLYLENNNYFALIVSDDGIGLPVDVDFQNTKSLGLRLVAALTKQLSGTLLIKRNIGTKFKITFLDK